MKVYELAKALGIENKTLIDYLTKEGCDIKSHMNVVTDKMADRAKNHFAKKEEAPSATGGIKAVVLPEHMLKKVEEEAKAKAAASQEESTEKSAKAAGGDDAAKKKKKIVGVFNPQYSSSLKGKVGSGNNQPKENKPAAPAKKPAQTRTYIPARDRKPDDYVEPVKE